MYQIQKNKEVLGVGKMDFKSYHILWYYCGNCSIQLLYDCTAKIAPQAHWRKKT